MSSTLPESTSTNSPNKRKCSSEPEDHPSEESAKACKTEELKCLSLAELKALSQEDLMAQLTTRRPNASEDLVLLTMICEDGNQYAGVFPLSELCWTPEEFKKVVADDDLFMAWIPRATEVMESHPTKLEMGKMYNGWNFTVEFAQPIRHFWSTCNFR